MKIHLVLIYILFPAVISAQTFKDTIFTKDKKNIPCTITFINTDNVFFADKRGEGQILSLSLVSHYSQTGKRNVAQYKPTIRTVDTMATINGELLRGLQVEYIQIVGTEKILGRKVIIDIDYGQATEFFALKDTRLADGKGETMIFNTMVDALNFFSVNGFEFVQAYAFTTGAANVYHYLLRKKQLK
jgi:hypothetical protein